MNSWQADATLIWDGEDCEWRRFGFEDQQFGFGRTELELSTIQRQVPTKHFQWHGRGRSQMVHAGELVGKDRVETKTTGYMSHKFVFGRKVHCMVNVRGKMIEGEFKKKKDAWACLQGEVKDPVESIGWWSWKRNCSWWMQVLRKSMIMDVCEYLACLFFWGGVMLKAVVDRFLGSSHGGIRNWEIFIYFSIK